MNENIAPVNGEKVLPVSAVTLYIAFSCSDVISELENTPHYLNRKQLILPRLIRSLVCWRVDADLYTKQSQVSLAA